MSQFELNEAAAQAMADHWMHAWNSRDINLIMSHFADNIEFNSPLIPRVLNEPGKTQLLGKEQIRHYFETALRVIPEIHLKLIQVLLGVDSVAMYYESVNGRLAVEVFFVDQAGKVYRTFNHYTTPKA